MIIRRKKLKDCEAWVDVNISSWNENLKGVVSDRLLKIIRDNRNTRIENDIAEFKEDDWNYVLEVENKVIGIMKIRPAERNGFENYGELQLLYLYKSEKGKGYGKALINRAFEVLKNKGYKKVIIGCLEGNPSNDFYKHMGGTLIKQEPWNIFGEIYIENIYEYEI